MLSRRDVNLSAGLAGLGLGLVSPGRALATPKVGAPAPGFELHTFEGKKVTLKDLRGQVVVLNFWATWCAPCKVELPLLDAYYNIQRKFGLQVFAIATEDSVSPDRLRPLEKALSITLVRRLYGPYDIIGNAVPTNYVIDRQGVVRYAKAGAFTLDVLNSLFIPLLQEPGPDDAPSGTSPSAT
jgi:peroxiredoxin